MRRKGQKQARGRPEAGRRQAKKGNLLFFFEERAILGKIFKKGGVP